MNQVPWSKLLRWNILNWSKYCLGFHFIADAVQLPHRFTLHLPLTLTVWSPPFFLMTSFTCISHRCLWFNGPFIELTRPWVDFCCWQAGMSQVVSHLVTCVLDVVPPINTPIAWVTRLTGGEVLVSSLYQITENVRSPCQQAATDSQLYAFTCRLLLQYYTRSTEQLWSSSLFCFW